MSPSESFLGDGIFNRDGDVSGISAICSPLTIIDNHQLL